MKTRQIAVVERVNENNDRKGRRYQGAPGTQITVNADLTIMALWKGIPAETCTITFDANGGSGTMEAVEIEKGQEYTLPTCEFTAPEGQEFDQWDQGVPGTQIIVNADLTIIAVWKDIPAEECE